MTFGILLGLILILIGGVILATCHSNVMQSIGGYAAAIGLAFFVISLPAFK